MSDLEKRLAAKAQAEAQAIAAANHLAAMAEARERARHERIQQLERARRLNEEECYCSPPGRGELLCRRG